MGNSIYASRVSLISHAASAAVIDLVLLLLIGSGAYTSSFDLLLFFRGVGISIFAILFSFMVQESPDLQLLWKGYLLSQHSLVLLQSDFPPIQGKIQW